MSLFGWADLTKVKLVNSLPNLALGVGGTSASSPIAAGVFALLNDYVIAKTKKVAKQSFILITSSPSDH